MSLSSVAPRRGYRTAPAPQLSLAEELETFELESLPAEVVRYLAAVDVFRAAGVAPTWRPESEEN
jgi:hypothetical protein